MASDEIFIVGVGMTTAVGLSAAETAASVRAGTMRFTPIPWLDGRLDPFTLAHLPDDLLPPISDRVDAAKITYREERMLRLATKPLKEAAEPAGKGARLGLVLAIPTPGNSAVPLDGGKFVHRLALQANLKLDPMLTSTVSEGRAGGMNAIAAASELIRKGGADLMLAGGVDSYRDLYLLGTLDSEGRVKSARHLDGFIPGEGAGFVLLASAKATGMGSSLKHVSRLSPVAKGTEPGHLYSAAPYRGHGLAEAFANLFSASPPESPIAEVYSSMNGESHWAREWGVAFLRNKTRFDPEHGMHHPADCYGDTGAACGTILTGLAALGIQQGYRRAPALVYASSDSAERAALWLTSAEMR